MSNSARRIVVTGASGVGKTTLVEMLAPLLRLSVIPEVARQLCEQLGFKYPGEMPDQEKFRRDVLRTQIETEQKTTEFLCDRSTIDCWVLWQRWQIVESMSYDTEAYYNQARSQSENYTHVLYIPPMFDPPEDGFRWTDKDYQRQIDRLVRFTISDWQLSDRTYVVQSTDADSRLKEVTQWLSSNSSKYI